MKTQLTLTFGETLAYSSETFVAHRGVRDIADTLVHLAAEERFALIYLYGLPRSGKTHLAVYCAGLLQSLGVRVGVIQPQEANQWLINQGSVNPRERSRALFIDDADRWLSEPRVEGVFTAVADALTQAKGVLVIFSSSPAQSLKLPVQLRSRLAAGVQLSLADPEEGDLDRILKALCAQRGMRLTEPKRRFILSRVPRTVPALASYIARLHEMGQVSTTSTSFEVLAAAL